MLVWMLDLSLYLLKGRKGTFCSSVCVWGGGESCYRLVLFGWFPFLFCFYISQASWASVDIFVLPLNL